MDGIGGTASGGRVGGRARVLVVDDERNARHLLVRALTAAGCAVDEAADAAAAWALVVDDGVPDVVVCDVLMPGHDGLWLLGRLRERFGEGAPPVVVLTVVTEHATVRAALDAGAETVLPKPFAPSEVVAAVLALAPARRARDAEGAT